MTVDSRWKTPVSYTALSILAIMTFIPFILMIHISLKDNAQFYAYFWSYKGFDWNIAESNYVYAWEKIKWPILNSLIVSSSAVVGVVFFSSLTAFVFARYEFPGRDFLFFMIIVLIMVPGEFSIVPLYLMMKEFNMTNTLYALIIPYWAGGQVVAIYILRSFFRTIPQDLFDSARIDGASDFKTYIHIALPLSKPIIITVALMNILGTWSDFIWPFIVLGDRENWTLSVALRSLQGEYAIEYGQMMAGYTIGCIPILILFFFTMNYFVKGLTSGALKG